MGMATNHSHEERCLTLGQAVSGIAHLIEAQKLLFVIGTFNWEHRDFVEYTALPRFGQIYGFFAPD